MASLEPELVGRVGVLCSRAYLAVFPDNLLLPPAFIRALPISTTHSQPRWVTRQECLSRAIVLLSSPSIIHGIDFCCVEYYMVFTFPGIIQQGKQIVFFGGKVNINSVQESAHCLSLMESNLFSCLCFEGAVISAVFPQSASQILWPLGLLWGWRILPISSFCRQ